MWYDYLEENFFIKKIFKIVPDLKSITILDVHFDLASSRLKIFIKMSKFVDYPPKKWGKPIIYQIFIFLNIII